MPREGMSEREQRYRDRYKPGGYKYQAPESGGQSGKMKDAWEQLAIEWVDAKENMRKNQKFMQETLKPAFETYQKRLSGISDEPGFKPINIKFGDFQTSIMPQQARINAEAMFKSQIGEAELNQPKAAEMSYLDKLMELGMFDRQMEIQNRISKRANKNKDDSGSIMDAAGDLVNLGVSGTKLWNMWG